MFKKPDGQGGIWGMPRAGWDGSELYDDGGVAARTVPVAAGAMDDVPLTTRLADVEGRACGLGMAVGNGRDHFLVGLGHGRPEPFEVGWAMDPKELLEEAHGYRPSITRSIRA